MEAGVEGARNTCRNQGGERMSLRHRRGNKAIRLHRQSMFENQKRTQPGIPAEVRPPRALRNARAWTPHSRAQSRQTPQRSQGTGGDLHRQASQHHQGEHKVTNKEREVQTHSQTWEANLPSHVHAASRGNGAREKVS